MKTNRDAWEKFLLGIATARDELKCPSGAEEEAWFRGHGSSRFTLLPSLFRHFREPNDGDWDRIWSTESDLYWEFSARARELHGATDTDWDILFAMQHHGTPTRLLDWTEVLGVAVYFALLGANDSLTKDDCGKPLPSPCVWVLNPNQLNLASEWECTDLISPRNLGWEESENYYYGYEELLVEDGMGWQSPVAIYPRQKTARIHAQRGWFTIHGDTFAPLEEFENANRFLRRVELPLAAIPEARDFLRSAGLDGYSLFPDLDNLSKHLRQKYRL